MIFLGRDLTGINRCRAGCAILFGSVGLKTAKLDLLILVLCSLAKGQLNNKHNRPGQPGIFDWLKTGLQVFAKECIAST